MLLFLTYILVRRVLRITIKAPVLIPVTAK